MLRSCLVRLRDNRLFCFYFQAGKGISYRIYENRKWGKETYLIDKGKENFTVNIDGNGVIYVFCQDDMGDIILCSNKSDTWTKKVVLKNSVSRIRMVQLNSIFTDLGLCLVYNIPNPEDKSNFIVYQILDGDGNWQPATRIDRFVSLSDSLFHMHRVSNNHYILYYMMRTGESSIGYREITPDKHGRYNIIHATGNNISDCSFLTTHDNIHALYVVKNMFSAQLLYRKKESDSFSNPIVMTEAQKIENCLLFFADGIIYATYIVNSQLFYCISHDSGNTFTRPMRYKNKFCLDPMKANYISEINQSENDFFCRQVYVDSNNLWDVQLLPDLCDNFYPDSLTKTVEPPVPVKQKVQESTSTQNKFLMNEDSFEEFSYYAQDAENFEDAGESLSVMKSRLAMYEDIIAEKDNQIFELTTLMKNRSDEMTGIEFDHQAQYRNLRSIYEETLNRLSELESKYSILLSEYEILTENKTPSDTYENIPEAANVQPDNNDEYVSG